MRLDEARVIGVLAIGVVLLSCPKRAIATDETIRRQIVKTAQAAEEKNLRFIAEQISDSFKSNDGLGKNEMLAFIGNHLAGGKWLRVYTSELHVSVLSEHEAVVSGKFILGRSGAKSLKDLAKETKLAPYAIDARLAQEDSGAWRFIWAKYEKLEPSSLVPSSIE